MITKLNEKVFLQPFQGNIMQNQFKHLRNHFPMLQQTLHGHPLTYFDNASTTHKPKQVLDAIMQCYTTSYANIYRGVHTFAEQATQQYEDARAKVAQFIGADDASEIVFTSGCTEGINFIVNTWGMQNIKAGDVIVVTEMEHHANLLPWQRLAQQKGAQLSFIPVTSDGVLDLSNLDAIITLHTKLVSFVDVSNALGTHNDGITIIKRAQAVGAKILIDAAQSVPHKKVNVSTVGADFLVFSGHKMLAPTGIGVLYINKNLHNEIEPYQLGGGIVFEADWQTASWLQAPQKFEAGTPPIAQAIGLGAAIDYINTYVDFDILRQHEAELCSRLIDGLSRFPSIKIIGPISQLKKHGHIVSFVIDGVHAHDVAAFLDTKGICVRAGHHCAQPLAKKLGYAASVRASFYCYNTMQEVDLLVGAVEELIRSL